jgi:cell filamentation protein
MSDKYGAEDDPACYPGTTVLRNLLDIRDPDQLQQAEAEFAAAAADAIEIGVGPFDLDYLRQLHRSLFGEVYPWAGQLRQVDISKGNTSFCTWTRIAPEAKRLLAALADGLARFPSAPSLVILVAEAYGEFNLIHPFREGNGRTQRMFFEHAGTWLRPLVARHPTRRMDLKLRCCSPLRLHRITGNLPPRLG